MFKRVKELNEALPEILLLDLLYLLIGEVIILLWIPNARIYAIGFLAGVFYSAFASLQMSLRIRKVVYGRAATTKTLLIGYFFRLAVMLVLFTILYYFQVGDLLAALLGMFSMKVSAYLQPLTNKFLTKFCEKGR